MSPPSSPSTTKPSSPLLPLPARFLASSHPSAGSGRVRLPAELGIALASAVRVRIDVVAKDPHERQPPSHLLSLLCWADVIPKQPAGGAFSHSEDSETVLVDFKTLSSSTLSSSTLLEGLFLRSGPLSFSSSSSLPPPLFRLVDVRPLGKAGRVPSATRVVVRQERLPRGKEGKSGSSSVSISKEALSVVLSNALVEAGSAIFPAGVASFAAEEEPVYSFLYLLRVVEVEPRESGASRVVRSTKVELEP